MAAQRVFLRAGRVWWSTARPGQRRGLAFGDRGCAAARSPGVRPVASSVTLQHTRAFPGRWLHDSPATPKDNTVQQARGPSADPVALARVQGHLTHMRAFAVLGETARVFEEFFSLVALVGRVGGTGVAPPPTHVDEDHDPQASALDVLAAGQPTWALLLDAARLGSTRSGTLAGGWELAVQALEKMYSQCGLVPRSHMVIKLAHGVADAGALEVLASKNDPEKEAMAGRMVERILDIGEACGIPPEQFN